MRILNVASDLSRTSGGTVTAIVGLSSALVRAGHEVVIAATGRDDSAPVPDGIEVELFPCRIDGWRLAPQLGRRLLERARWADLVNVQDLWHFPCLASARASSRAGTPYVIRLDGLMERWSLKQRSFRKRAYTSTVAGRLLRRAAALHVTTERELRESVLTRGSAPAFVLPLGIDASSGDPHRFERRFPAIGSSQVVLFVGRLHPKKQPDILIRAFAACDAARNARLVLAGDGDQTFVRDLSGLARKLAIDDRLIFTGQLDREGVADAFARATVLALPSLQENLGFVALEAMAASKPVILSNRVGLADDVVAYDAGIVGEPTISTFVDALDRILRDPELGRCMGLAGSALARERYSWSTVTCEFECIYRDIINGSRMSSAWRDGVATG